MSIAGAIEVGRISQFFGVLFGYSTDERSRRAEAIETVTRAERVKARDAVNELLRELTEQRRYRDER